EYVVGILYVSAFRTLWAAEAGLDVERIRDQLWPHQRTGRTSGEWHAGDPADARERLRVLGDLLEGLVTRDGRDRKQLEVRVSPGQEHGDGVVVAGVAVEDDLARLGVIGCRSAHTLSVPRAPGRQRKIGRAHV